MNEVSYDDDELSSAFHGACDVQAQCQMNLMRSLRMMKLHGAFCDGFLDDACYGDDELLIAFHGVYGGQLLIQKS